MNPNETNPGDLPVTGWQVLGELELNVGSSVEQQIHTWLGELLLPLELPENFMNKLFASAHECSLRALRSSAEAGHGPVHLAILVQREHEACGHTWGFFRTEKIDNAEENISHPDHLVEFYLCVEGQ